MGSRRWTGALVAVAVMGAQDAQAAKRTPVAKDKQPTVLIITASQGKRSSLAKAAEARLKVAARKESLRPVVVRSAKKLSLGRIRGAAAIVLATNRGTVLTRAQEDVLNARIRNGAGVVIIGSSVRMQPNSQDFETLVGAQPAGTDTPKKAEVQFVDRIHPATALVPRRWSITAPWVSLKKNITGRVHVLGWVDEKAYAPGDGLAMGVEHPVTWCRDLGEGRSFTTTLGLDKAIWRSPVFAKMVQGAVAYAAGRRIADCGATVWSNWKRTVIDTDITDGTQLDVGPDGRVYYIEHTGSTLKIYDPRKDVVQEAGYIPSVPGLGQGLLGLAVDPNFTKTRWIYLYYHLEGLIGRLSRFTLGKDDQLDRLSEKVILRIPNTGIDHNGGGLAIDPRNGNLYLAIGSNDMPHFDGEYGSRGPEGGVVTQVLGTNGEITSQNTDSLLGKVLRIHPEPDGSYTIPKGNMFPPGTDKTLPEIFSMGHRNAFHVKVDEITGDVLEGDVGADARTDDPKKGTMGYDEFNLIKAPANYGYPYCNGPNLAWNDVDAVTGLGSGKPFDCNHLVYEESPGIKDLGPAAMPWIWYPYGVGKDFPEMSEAWAGGPDSGRLAIPGPRYYAKEGSRMPAFFDGSWFIADWTRNWIKQVVVDDDGKPLRIQRFAPNRGTQAPIDMDIAPDGSLYVIEWGGQSIPVGNPLAAKVVRYQYVPKCGTCDPTVTSASSSALPGVGVSGNVIAAPLAQTAGFLTPNPTLAAGSTLTFTNLDPVAPHNLASKEVTEDGRRLFAAPNGSVGSVQVEGTDKLKPGRYDFLCTIHPSMTGTLEVQ